MSSNPNINVGECSSSTGPTDDLIPVPQSSSHHPLRLPQATPTPSTSRKRRLAGVLDRTRVEDKEEEFPETSAKRKRLEQDNQLQEDEEDVHVDEDEAEPATDELLCEDSFPRTVRPEAQKILDALTPLEKDLFRKIVIRSPLLDSIVERHMASGKDRHEGIYFALREESQKATKFWELAKKLEAMDYLKKDKEVAWSADALTATEREERITRHESTLAEAFMHHIRNEFTNLRDHHHFVLNFEDPAELIRNSIRSCSNLATFVRDGFPGTTDYISLYDLAESKERNKEIYEEARTKFPKDWAGLRDLMANDTNRKRVSEFIRHKLKFDYRKFMELLLRMVSDERYMPRGVYLQRALLNVADYFRYDHKDGWSGYNFDVKQLARGLTFNIEGVDIKS